MKVFVVDDSPLIRERLKELLDEIPGIKLIGQAGQCLGASEAVLAAKPDVLILDIQFRDGSGINILKKLKFSETPLVKIMLTAFPNSLYRQRCLEAGADYFLDKTMDFNRLAEVISDLAQKQINSYSDNPDGMLKGQEGLAT